MQDGGADVACERRLRRGEALQTARGAKAVPLAHEKPDEGGGLNQEISSRPRTWTRRSPPTSRCANPRWLAQQLFPLWIRRRLSFCASRFRFHFRRPRLGSLT